MLVTNQKSVWVTKLENYGSDLHPLYTVGVELELRGDESPDTIHKLLTEMRSRSFPNRLNRLQFLFSCLLYPLRCDNYNKTSFSITRFNRFNSSHFLW
jgi:hypothetical protein